MSRRDRRPGTIKYNPTSQNTFAPQDREGMTSWLSIDPTVNGPPSAVPDPLVSVPQPGTWYIYDGNGTLGDDGSGNYFSVTTQGLTCYLKRDDPTNTKWGHLYNSAGRFATPLTKPNGEQLTWKNNFGIEFLVKVPDAPTSTTGRYAGITIGLAEDAIYSSVVDDGVSSYFLSTWHSEATTQGLAYQIGGPSGAAGDTGGDSVSYRSSMCVPVFGSWRSIGATNIWGFYIIGYKWKDDGAIQTRHSATSVSTSISRDSNVNLFIAPNWNLDKTGSVTPTADTITLQNWQLFYRLRYTDDAMNPDYVPGRRNNHSGLTKDSY